MQLELFNIKETEDVSSNNSDEVLFQPSISKHPQTMEEWEEAILEEARLKGIKF